MAATPIRRRIVLAALLAGLACVDPAPAAPPEKAETKGALVPFEMLATNHMLVSATINGKGPYELIFDVGAPITLLSNKAAIDSGTVKADAPRSMLFSLRGEADVKTLKVGDLSARDVPVIVLDHPLLKAMGQMLGRRLDGIMGYTFFARYRTTIDYQARKMTFEPVETKVRNLMKDLPDRLAGPRVARHRMLSPGGLWGLDVGDPAEGLETPGVPVRTVLADSPAARAGVKAGDVLTTLDGRWTTTVSDTYAAAAAAPANRAVPVVVLRDGKELTLAVTPAEGF